MQNRDFRTIITSLYGSLPSSVDFASKSATLGPDLQVSTGPSPHQWCCAFKTGTFGPELPVSTGPRPHLGIGACKTVCLPPELQVSMGPSAHLCFLHAYSDFWTRITSLYWSQT